MRTIPQTKERFFELCFQRRPVEPPPIDPPNWIHFPHRPDNVSMREEPMEYIDAEDPPDTDPLRIGVIRLSCIILVEVHIRWIGRRGIPFYLPNAQSGPHIHAGALPARLRDTVGVDCISVCSGMGVSRKRRTPQRMVRS